jgi:hypothetical protein
VDLSIVMLMCYLLPVLQEAITENHWREPFNLRIVHELVGVKLVEVVDA